MINPLNQTYIHGRTPLHNILQAHNLTKGWTRFRRRIPLPMQQQRQWVSDAEAVLAEHASKGWAIFLMPEERVAIIACCADAEGVFAFLAIP